MYMYVLLHSVTHIIYCVVVVVMYVISVLIMSIKGACDKWKPLEAGGRVAQSHSSTEQGCACGHFVEPQLLLVRR